MRPRLAALVLCLAACGSSTSKAPPDAKPVHVPSPSAAVVDPCRRAIAELTEALRGMASASQPTRTLTSEPWYPGLACAALYRQPACAEAWKAGLAPPGDAGAIYAACRDAYCARLGRDCPAAKPAGVAATLEELVALDAKILALEGVDPFAIRVFAERARIFRVVTVASPGPASQPATAPALTLVIDAQGGISAGGRPLSAAALDAKLKELAKSGGQLVVAAEPRTPHGKVVGLLDQAKRAGVARVAIASTPAP